MDRTPLFEHKPKESSNGEPPGAGFHSIYYNTCELHKAICRAMHCAYLCYNIIVQLGLGCMTSRVTARIARCTGLDYCRIRCADKILCTIRQDVI